MSKYLLALDAGTGSIRAVLFSVDGEQVGVAQCEWENHEDPRWPGSMDFDWVADWQLIETALLNLVNFQTPIDGGHSKHV